MTPELKHSPQTVGHHELALLQNLSEGLRRDLTVPGNPVLVSSCSLTEPDYNL